MTAGSAMADSASWLARNADQATQLAAIRKDMKALLAGPHAQARYQPRKTKRIPNEWASDFKLAKSCATKAVLIRNGRGADVPIGEGTFEIALGADDLAEIDRLFNRVSNETEAPVAKLWPAITLVAEELLTRRSLFEDEVDALIREATDGGEIASMTNNVRFGSKADICAAKGHVRFTPESGHVRCTSHVRFVPKADTRAVTRTASKRPVR